MCGIVGIATRGGGVSEALIERLTQSLAHRGPDDSGTVVFPYAGDAGAVALGNRRLAIFDLSAAGHQPMRDPATGNWIVFNGEIYNFRELRKELEQDGIDFSGHSDTEVLLKAYRCWGERCLSRLRGMFAFAIWDAKLGQLFLARDPMGIKPLYYGVFGDYFIFASEVRTILASGLPARQVDHGGLLNYLSFGSAYDPVTLVKGVSSLLPGHKLHWGNGRIEELEYWDPLMNRDAPASLRPYAEVVSRLQQTIRDSVRMQMASDVPVGVFLSGGIDSSSLVAMLAGQGIRPETFSIAFQEKDYSEADYSSLVSRAFGTKHHEITISAGETLSQLAAAIDAMDQPTIDGVNLYLIAQNTRAAGIKVALSGLGGDELFAGYSSFTAVPKMERFASLWKRVPARELLSTVYSWLTPPSDRQRRLVGLLGGDELHPYFLSRMLFTADQRKSLLGAGEGESNIRAWGFARSLLDRATSLDAINRVSYLETRCYMANTLLRDTDMMSMAHGLEIRVPLIDPAIVEQLFVMPGRWKFDGDSPKKVLVEACLQPLPAEVVRRKKRGFTFPFAIWLRQEMRNEVEATLRDAAHGAMSGLLNGEAIWQVWRDFLSGRTSWSRPWALYVLQRWCDRNSIES